MTQEKINQTKRALAEKLAEPYRMRLAEAGNGHTMERWVERDVDTGDLYVLIVRDQLGRLVGMSRTPDPDPDSEREFRVDFLMEEKS